jgi:hypothetical protein
VKIYLDGDTAVPTASGTGTEDYIGTGWGMGPYTHLYQGCTLADKAAMRFCFYRYHVLDPVYFRKDIRVTIQQIGYAVPEQLQAIGKSDTKLYEAGPVLAEKDLAVQGLFEREDDWSSCAYFYLDKPDSKLPSLQTVEERVKGLF